MVREVAKAKQKAYDELCDRLAGQRDRAGNDVQQALHIKDWDGSVLKSEESVLRRWETYFKELMDDENERKRRVEEV